MLLFLQLVTLHGLEADRHLLQCLFSSVDFSEVSAKVSNIPAQNQVLSEHCATLINNPSSHSAICYAVEHPLASQKARELT